MFTEELRGKAEELVGRYPVARSALLPLLHLVQAQDGYLSDDGISECAQLLALTKAEVGAVATFYTMYKRVPLGRHLVSVCTNFSCKVRGAQEVYDRLHERLGVGHNQTTQDGAITLEHAECLGNCEGAPVVSVDYLNYECLTPDAAEDIVGRLIAGEVPPPTRGIPSPGIRDVEYRLAGLGPRPGAADEPGVPTDRARAADGGVPAVDEDTGMQPIEIETPQTGAVRVEGREPDALEESEAERQVAEAGDDPDDVDQEAGPQSREFLTGDGDAPQSDAEDPRQEGQPDA